MRRGPGRPASSLGRVKELVREGRVCFTRRGRSFVQNNYDNLDFDEIVRCVSGMARFIEEGRAMFCCECGNEMRYTREPITERFRGEEITVDGIERYVCDKCGNDVMSSEMATRLSMGLARRYARRRGLLTPEEIKDIRSGLGLTQIEFEILVGVSSPTVCRWERGTSFQSRSADLLLRALRDLPEVEGYLRHETGLDRGPDALGERSSDGHLELVAEG